MDVERRFLGRVLECVASHMTRVGHIQTTDETTIHLPNSECKSLAKAASTSLALTFPSRQSLDWFLLA